MINKNYFWITKKNNLRLGKIIQLNNTGAAWEHPGERRTVRKTSVVVWPWGGRSSSWGEIFSDLESSFLSVTGNTTRSITSEGILTKSPISFHLQFNFSRVSRGRSRPRQNAPDDLVYSDTCLCFMCPICSQVVTGLFRLGKLRF